MKTDLQKYILREKDLKVYENLLESITANQCVGFVGAGVSVNKGYRAWKNLIYDTSRDHSNPGFLEYANIDPNSYLNKSLPELTEKCFEKLGKDKYNNFIKNEYARKLNEISDNHILICKTNLRHIITTNFDPCFYDNGMGFCNNFRCYPGNELELLPDRTIYHIHGRAFIKPNESDELLDTLIENLIFREASYKKAYKDGFEIKAFIYTLLKKYKLLFVGFSLEDEEFTSLLESISKAIQQFFNEVSALQNISINAKNDLGYIFIQYPVEEYSKIINKTYSGEKEKKKVEQTLDDFITKESAMNELGLKFIAYNPIDKNHSGLTNLLQITKNKATYVGLKEPDDFLGNNLSDISNRYLR